MALSTTDLSPRIGTQIHTDLETLVSGRHAAEIRQLAEQRGVLLFRGIEMNDEQQLAFTRTLGPVQGDKSGDVYKVSFDPVESPEFYFYTPGNFSWHIDRTDSDVPPFCTILNSKRLALEGGETEFANTYAAWEDLPEADKALVEKLRCIHLVESSFREHVRRPSLEMLKVWRSNEPRSHPLVWSHHSGRKSLILAWSGTYIEGMDDDEGAALLRRLMDWATQPQYVYVHEWQEGDIVLWDNTGTMHRARPYPDDSPRLHHRTTVLGEEPFDTVKGLEAA
jgi:alpha-ketoglutarate-dependent taurine dioxygenase